MPVVSNDAEIAVAKNDENEDEDESASIRTFLAEKLDLKDVQSEDGAVFEVKETTLPGPSLEDWEFEEKYNGPEMLKHVRREIAAIDSGDEEEPDKNISPFEQIGRNMEDISPDQDRTLLKQIEKVGHGEIVPSDALVTIHYNAYIEYNEEPFDSTYLRNRPHRFRLGEGRTVLGLDYGVKTMKVGEVAKFLVSSDLAYGMYGCPPRVPENATILYEVHLDKCVDNAASEAFKHLPPEEQNTISFSEVMKVCHAERQSGNNFVENYTYHKAAACYNRAIRILQNHTYANEEEEKTANKLLLVLYLNVALGFDKLGQNNKVLRVCREALKLDSNNTKALFRLGRAYNKIKDYSEARKHLIRAQKNSPHDAAITKELDLLNEHQKKDEMDQKLMCQRMFSSFKMPASSTVDKLSSTEPTSNTVGLPYCNMVSDEFKDMVLDNLSKLKADKDRCEIFLPNFDQNEINCVCSTAKFLGGLSVDVKNGVIKVFKTESQ